MFRISKARDVSVGLLVDKAESYVTLLLLDIGDKARWVGAKDDVN